jgi:hypothetical protein
MNQNFNVKYYLEATTSADTGGLSITKYYVIHYQSLIYKYESVNNFV